VVPPGAQRRLVRSERDLDQDQRHRPREELARRLHSLERHQPAAVAGQHNKGKRIVLVFDEASEIADIIFETAEGALTDENTEIIWILLGNPTRAAAASTTPVFGRQKHRWKSWTWTRGRSKAPTKRRSRSGADYGEDSDWFRVHVRGLPPAGFDRAVHRHGPDSAAQRRIVSPSPMSRWSQALISPGAAPMTTWSASARGQDARSIPTYPHQGRIHARPGGDGGQALRRPDQDLRRAEGGDAVSRLGRHRGSGRSALTAVGLQEHPHRELRRPLART
jgi:hypothetical protein